MKRRRPPPPPIGGRSREAREKGRQSRPTAGLTLLEQRIAEIPDALRRTAALPDPHLSSGLHGARGVVTTGVGSSRAQARLLAHLVTDRAGVAARFLPLGALAEAPPAGAADEILVLFSQGLSPNAWLALEHASAWRRVIIVTAATERTSDERGRRFRELESLGANLVRFAGDDEFGLLVRVVGPVCGMLAAFRLARRLSEALGGRELPAVEVEKIVSAMTAAARRVPKIRADELVGNLGFVASGGYGALADNLAAKVLEGMLRPLPPVWDVFDFAHGPFQQLADAPATLLVLARRDAAGEPALLARLEAMLDPARHRLVPLVAELPGALALFEHEAQMNELLRRFVAERGDDPADWPGRGRDRPLYDVSKPPTPVTTLEGSTWPEIERALAAEKTTLVVPLGATEQHGPHLPLATDAWIAGELAERLCRRFPDAIAAPVLAIGCSSEHGAFPGTLSLTPGTLERVLADLLTPLHGHGFRRAFVFSAHGGNVATLREMLPRLREAAAPLEVTLFGELDELADGLHVESAKFGISAEASGHHAGELETSILLALRPGAVRAGRLEPGFVEPTRNAQSIFYPSLRDRSPTGVVGDPREADAARAEAYLEAWVDRLAVAYRG